jgi:hypothetical protein
VSGALQRVVIIGMSSHLLFRLHIEPVKTPLSIIGGPPVDTIRRGSKRKLTDQWDQRGAKQMKVCHCLMLYV